MNVSLASTVVSTVVATLTVCAAIEPAAKVTCWVVWLKSPAEVVPSVSKTLMVVATSTALLSETVNDRLPPSATVASLMA